MSKNLVVILHGVGSSGDNLADLAKHWQSQLSETQVIAPDAPFASDFNNGRQWFSISGVTESNRAGRIAEARADLDALLNRLFDQSQFDPKQGKLFLAGFSQGAIMSLDMLVNPRFELAGVIAFSGRLASPKPWQPSAPALIIHGEADPVMPVMLAQQTIDALTALNVAVQSQFEEHTGHFISNEGQQRALAFIRDQLGQ